jgi:hypothetical protein
MANKDQLQYPMGVDENSITENSDYDLQTKQEDQVNFSRKVFGIVAAQMCVTFALTLASSMFPVLGRFF